MVKVLDKGSVELIDFVGGDQTVADTARISTMTSGTEQEDRKLVKYLIKMDHGTPFEHSYFTFYIKCPIFVARQWFRHRISSYNEMSMRYVMPDREYYVPSNLNDEEERKYKEAIENAFNVYDELLGTDVKKEQARGVLPVGMYTQFYWTINARALMNFLNLRLDRSAQFEIREYAKAMLLIFREQMPATGDAFLLKMKGELNAPHQPKEFPDIEE